MCALFSAKENSYAPTYDLIEKDAKLTLEAQLGLIGGTMGLFSGFSTLSAVEILYFASKFNWSKIKWRKA